MVNGHPTEAVLSFSNEEPEPVRVNFIGGSLYTPDFDPKGSRIVRNLTANKYSIEIPAGEKETVTYKFVTELHPQELRLNLAAVLTDHEGQWYTIQAYNSTVTVVDPDTSIFDPQMLVYPPQPRTHDPHFPDYNGLTLSSIFLYLFLAGIFSATIYFFYTIWILPYFPAKGKGGERAKRSSGGSKRVDPSEAIPVVGADGPAVTTGSAFSQDWIPAHHLSRPEARRVKSGGPRPKSKGKGALSD